MTLKEIASRIRSVEGWLSKTEGRLLYRLAKKCRGRGVIVEIGSWKGKSTIWLAHGSRASSGVKVHAVDPHTGSPEHQDIVPVSTFDEFRQNIAQANVDDLVVPHVAFSEECAKTFDQPVELIFIDGLHEWEGVKADFDSWAPKVIEGGVMVFHDSTCWDGVRRLVIDYVYKSRHFRNVGFSGSMTYGERVACNTAGDRLRNRVVLSLFLIHAYIDRQLWRIGHNKVLPLLKWVREARSRGPSQRAAAPELIIGK
jgi:predicted O-methyltransferase YrrM